MKAPTKSIWMSVIIPVGSRHGDLEALYEEYKQGLQSVGYLREVIFVLDGPQPRAAQALQKVLEAGNDIAVIQLTRAFGEATAIMAAFERARGDIIVTLPAYHQIVGSEIPLLIEGLDSADLCVGHRTPRVGGAIEKMRRSLFHKIVSGVTGVHLRDLGCNARAMRRKVLEEISLYGDQHRFLAVLADRQGFRTKEVDLLQSPQDRFEGVYRPREYVRRILDIFSVFFLVRFTKRPLRFFGMAGASMFGIGLAILLVLVAQRVFGDVALSDRPALLLTSLLVVLGLQLFALGLLGELVIFTHAKNVKDYQVAEVIEFASPTSSNGIKAESKPTEPSVAAGLLERSLPLGTAP